MNQKLMTFSRMLSRLLRHTHFVDIRFAALGYFLADMLHVSMARTDVVWTQVLKM